MSDLGINPTFYGSTYQPSTGYGGLLPTPQPVFPYQMGGIGAPQTPQFSLFQNPATGPLFGQAGSSGGLQKSPQQAGRTPGQTTLVEWGYSPGGDDTEHAEAVKNIYERYNPGSDPELIGIGVADGDSSSSGNNTASEKTSATLKTKQELDQYIDDGSTAAFQQFGEQIEKTVDEGQSSVINGSLGYARNNVYEDTLGALQENPKLATHLNLKPSDIQNLKTNEDGQTLVSDKVSQAIVQYVDQRLDAPNSAFQQARQDYQQITQRAAQNGVVTVVSAGNDHELNSVFERQQPGGDTNFLAQSDSIISVAASDNRGTPYTGDDTIGDFSSYGDGRYNPTVASDGVQVDTGNGKKEDGTSFSAPKVAATVAQLQKENPNLTFDQIKNILQSTATNTQASNLAEGAGILNPNAALQVGQGTGSFGGFGQYNGGYGQYPRASGY